MSLRNPFTKHIVPFLTTDLSGEETITLEPTEPAWASEKLQREPGPYEALQAHGWRKLMIDHTGVSMEKELAFLNALALLHQTDDGVWVLGKYANQMYSPDGIFNYAADSPKLMLAFARILVEWTLPGRTWRLHAAMHGLADNVELHNHLGLEASEVEIALMELQGLIRD
jgi:hypothetical protein